MNKLNIQRCPVCGSEHLKPFLDCTDHYATGEKFAVVRCETCGFKLTQDVPVEAEIGRYYESPDYISHTDTRKGLMNQIYHLIRGRMLERKARIVCRVTHRHRGAVLDIGTGTGYFAGAMRARGWQASATEKNEKARQFARDNFGVDVRDEAALATYPEHSFDAITMWHVLEHIEHLDDMAETWKRLLAEKGAVILALPNCASADAQKYAALWAAYDVPRHLWHFTPDTLRRFAQKHGFRVLKEYAMPFDAFYVSMLSEKYKGTRLYFIKGAWTGFRAYLKAMGNKHLSSSLIYILKPQN